MGFVETMAGLGCIVAVFAAMIGNESAGDRSDGVYESKW